MINPIFFRVTLFSIFCLLSFQFSSFSKEYPLIGELNEDKIHIRADSTIGSASIGLLNEEERLEILDSRYDWYKVNIPTRFSIYANAKYLEKVETNKAEVTARVLNLRAGPSLKAAIIGKAKEGDIFIIRKKIRNWLELAGSSTTYGWVHKKFIDIVENNDSLAQNTLVATESEDISLLAQNILKANESLQLINSEQPHDSISFEKTQEPKKLEEKSNSSWDYFILKGTLSNLDYLDNCEANYKLKGLYSTIFLKIEKNLDSDVSSLLNNAVKVEGRRKYGKCSYIEVENIYLVQ